MAPGVKLPGPPAFTSCIAELFALQQPTNIDNLPLAVLLFENACFTAESRHVEGLRPGIFAVLVECHPRHIPRDAHIDVFNARDLCDRVRVISHLLLHASSYFIPTLPHRNAAVFPPAHDAHIIAMCPRVFECIEVLVVKCHCLTSNPTQDCLLVFFFW